MELLAVPWDLPFTEQTNDAYQTQGWVARFGRNPDFDLIQTKQ